MTIVTPALAADAGTALRSWGNALGGAVEDVARGLGGEFPRTLSEGIAELTPVARSSVHSIGWELRGAFAWRNDDRCIQRAAFGALALIEREAGGMRAGIGELAVGDARRAAIAVNYTPNFSASVGRARLHAAAMFRTHEGEVLVIDHLVADADDGVLTLEQWMQRTGGTADAMRVVDPLHMPPPSRSGGAGIPSIAQAHRGDQWRAFAGHLATGWIEAARYGSDQVTRLR